MSSFYFDESIHHQANFILGAFVYSDVDLDADVAEALEQSGLRPGIDEFKSGSSLLIVGCHYYYQKATIPQEFCLIETIRC